MDYKRVLKLFSLEGPGVTLTSSSFSAHLISQLKKEYTTDQTFISQFNPKRVSGDLDRLYKMSLMTRKRVKRRVVTSRGTEVWRGYQYEYKISKQGWQYINFLEKPKTAKVSVLDVIQDATLRVIIDDLYKKNPEPVADFLAGAFSDKEFEDRGRHQRFPKSRRMKLLTELSECCEKLARKSKEIEALKKQISMLQGTPAWKERA